MGGKILKYGLYAVAGLWMFALGVMVGRGNAPVTFDTRGFQARLQAIALEYGSREKPAEQVDLKFYDALNNPVRHEVKGRVKKSGEILPRPETVPIMENQVAKDGIPVKMGKKQESLNRDLMAEYKKKSGQPPVSEKAVSASKAVKEMKTASKEKKPLKKKAGTRASEKKSGPAPDKGGKYTIQVAAYKDFTDAVSEMAALEKKGITAYRIKGEKDGVTWYRVRTGAFPDYKTAAVGLDALKKAKVNGMIIKKE